MAKKIQSTNSGGFAIRIEHEDGSVGWLTGPDSDVRCYTSAEDAEKALKQMKRGNHYSWNCKASVAEFNGFTKPKKEGA